MRLINKIKTEGVSLRLAHQIMVIVSFIIMAILLFKTFESGSTFSDLSEATNNYIYLEKDADALMSASDFLTDKVQRFTVTFEREHMDAYFEEAETTRRREHALENMERVAGGTEAYEKLQEAMKGSLELMNTEYYAMRLIIDAKGYTNYPAVLDTVVIDPADAALGDSDKIILAQQKVHNDDYYSQKMQIRMNMEECLKTLESDTHSKQKIISEEVTKQMKGTRFFIIIQCAATVFVLLMTSYLGINPIIKGVEKIKEDSEIPIIGSYEFRYLAKTYNKMYEAFKKSIANLNYDASHDKLTGVYNRSGYDILSQSIDLRSTAALLIDADKFKEINDTHGHATGDKVLKKIAAMLRRTFRSEDYICRIGGDEFVVFMLHMDEERRELIKLKVGLINKGLADTSDDLPPISVSIGVAFGKDVANVSTLIKNADEALYRMKNRGRGGCCFYTKPTDES